MCQGAAGGTYHYWGAPAVSWAKFARVIFAEAGKSVTVHDISTDAYPTPSRRPLNSRLDCTSLRRDFGIAQPAWRDELRDVIQQIQRQP